MAKYEALGEQLRKNTGGSVQLTFEEVAGFVPGGLPQSAYRHLAWWANDPHHVQAAAWLKAGWRSENANLAARSVTFTRG